MSELAFRAALGKILPVEGGFVDDPQDSGGATRWGVTERLAREYGYKGAMHEYPKSDAERVYRLEFWERHQLDDIAEISGDIAVELFEQIINGSPGGMHLQRILNAANNGGGVYPDLRVDGRIGPATVRALFSFIRARKTEGEKVLLAGLNACQAVYYLELAERRPKDERFFYGWLRARVMQ